MEASCRAPGLRCVLLATVLVANVLCRRRLDWKLTQSPRAPLARHRQLPVPFPIIKAPEDHEVHTLPGLPATDLRQHAGTIPVDESTNAHLFYWLFHPPLSVFKGDAAAAARAPIVVWFNGGPGSSSMEGLFAENGPFRLSPNGTTLELNPHAWHLQGVRLLFVDQPGGTGLSHVNAGQEIHSDTQLTTQLLEFFQRFFQLHAAELTLPLGSTGNKAWSGQLGSEGASIRASLPLFIFGESWAGHFIPAFTTRARAHARDVLAAAAAADGSKDGSVGSESGDAASLGVGASAAAKTLLDVRGVGVGNGWIDPASQYEMGAFMHGRGHASEQQRDELLRQFESRCAPKLKAFGQGVSYGAVNAVGGDSAGGRHNVSRDDHGATSSTWRGCIDLYSTALGLMRGGGYKAIGYDLRTFVRQNDRRRYPLATQYLAQYLDRDDVRDALHLPRSALYAFTKENDPLYFNFLRHDGIGVLGDVELLLGGVARSASTSGSSLAARLAAAAGLGPFAQGGGVPLLLYVGSADLVCHELGHEKLIDALRWPGRATFRGSRRSAWGPLLGRPYGSIRSGGGLTFVTLSCAGHLAPMDAPRATAAMLRRFVRSVSVSGLANNALFVTNGDYVGEDDAPECRSPVCHSDGEPGANGDGGSSGLGWPAVSLLCAMFAVIGGAGTAQCVRVRNRTRAARRAIVAHTLLRSANGGSGRMGASSDVGGGRDSGEDDDDEMDVQLRLPNAPRRALTSTTRAAARAQI